MRSKDPRLAFLADKATGLMYYDAKEITKVYSCTRTREFFLINIKMRLVFSPEMNFSRGVF